MMSDFEQDKIRTAIFFFSDPRGIVDDYIYCLVDSLKPFISELVFVVDKKLRPNDRNALQNRNFSVVVAKDLEDTFSGYQFGIKFLGWEKIQNLDELIFLNDTVFGPLDSFEQMFFSMDKKEIDFWGINLFFTHEIKQKGKRSPKYIPSHFFAVRKQMLQSYEFVNFWDNYPVDDSELEEKEDPGIIFSQSFEDFGFTSDVFVKTEDLISFSHKPLVFMPLELVRDRGCPIVLKESFALEYSNFLDRSLGETTFELLEYLKSETNYNTQLILQNLLRTINAADIKKSLHLNYVLSEKHQHSDLPQDQRIALFLHIFSVGLAKYCFEYAKSMPSNIDVYITTNTIEKKMAIARVFADLPCRKLEILLVNNRGRDVSALLIGLKPFVNDYDLICFVHDKKSGHFYPQTIGASFSYKCFENLLATPQYVTNIINLFDEEPNLGMLFPPPPNHAKYAYIFGQEWGPNFKNTIALAEKLEVDVDIQKSKEPIAPLGTMFWFRPEALKPLLKKEWTYEDFPEEPTGRDDGLILHAIERLYGYAAQSQGLYPAWVMSEKFASIEFTNLHFIINEYKFGVLDIWNERDSKIVHPAKVLDQIPFEEILKYKLKNSPFRGIYNILRAVKNFFANLFTKQDTEEDSDDG